MQFLTLENGKAKPSGDLKRWIDYQNLCFKKQKQGIETDLTEDRIRVLDEVDFPWKMSNDEHWEKQFGGLKDFADKNGHCKVPCKYPIGEWVSTQRKEMKKYNRAEKSSLTPERVEKLCSIGFEWNLNDWDNNFAQLRVFKETHAHCSVPRNHGTLGRWVAYQRDRYWTRKEGKKSTITDDQINKLKEIDFEWSAY